MGANMDLDLALDAGSVLELAVAEAVGVAGSVWRVLASLQSASAVWKHLMASESLSRWQAAIRQWQCVGTSCG